MGRKILLMGHTGKMGLALGRVFQDDYDVVGCNSQDLHASDFDAVTRWVVATQPDLVINTIAFMGIDACEQHPDAAQQLNTLLPRHLAQLSSSQGFVLVHFSTDAVFDNAKPAPRIETDCPRPINLYGLTKLGGECLVACHAPRHYLFRLPVLFGLANRDSQFVEKMLKLVAEGRRTLKISQDVVSSPSYSLDLAWEVRRVVEQQLPWGLYHLCNQGAASLYDLMKAIVQTLELDVDLLPVSHQEFPSVGVKNLHTPMATHKLPPLRPWQEAVASYCAQWKGARP